MKAGIGRSITAAIIPILAFALSEVLEQALGVDRLLPALLIAGACTLAFKTISWFDIFVSNKLLPGVDNSSDYVKQRRHGVFEAAHDSAMLDGVITTGEQAMLDTQAESLQIQAEELHNIRLRLQTARPA